ncbi:MAG: hypothetical protein ABIO67_00790 [Mycobacteriales bacterium]
MAASAASTESVQLTDDPCGLVLASEAQAAVGQPVTQGRNRTVCTYTASGNGGHLAVETLSPPFCQLLLSALKANMFAGDQVRVDDLGDGGMLVKGNGSLQFTSHGGCVSIEVNRGDSHPTDDVMLGLGRAAAGRVV